MMGAIMVTTELTGKVTELKELKKLSEELAAEITAIEDTIKAEMTARNVERLDAGVYTISWTQITSNRFDSASFKATHGDLYAQYSRPVQSRRFCVR
jgi:predicted phage-related endonuclease